MRGQEPTAEARSLSESVATNNIDEMLNQYVKPSFLKMSDEKRKAAIEMLNKMAAE